MKKYNFKYIFQDSCKACYNLVNLYDTSWIDHLYSKTQAKLILKTFFLKNKPTDFNIVHSGDSKNNSHYSIGNLTTKNGAFRTYILYKEVEGKITILELKIESDE